MRTKVLVTGANGQLGRTIQDLFKKNNDGIEFTFVTKSQLDISKKDHLQHFFSNHSFDYCVNCAAYTNVEQAEESINEASKINDEAVGFLAECCSQTNTILIHISTDYVFDGKKAEPYLETDSTNPLNQYGLSKLAGEKQIQKISKNYFIIRTSWLYSKYPKNFVTTIVTKILEDLDLTITTSQIGIPTSCIELSKFIYWLIIHRNSDFGIYHFSAKGETTWYGFALKIAEYFPNFNTQKISSTSVFNSKATRPNYSVMDNSKVQSIYNGQNFWATDIGNVVMDILKNTD